MKFDAIVIGSGQAGNPLSYAMAERGWTVALIERDHLGGTCVNTGCTPTKTMIASAQVAHYVRNAARWGVKTEKLSVDLPAIVARKNAIVQSFRNGHERRIAQHSKLRLFWGQACFVSPRRVQVGEEILESERIFINTGTRTEIPRLTGLESVNYVTNASLMDLQDIPEHLLVIGGGYIGLEFGQTFRRFGSRVTVVHRGEQLLAREDADIATELQKALEAEGVEFRLKSQPTMVQKRDGKLLLTIQSVRGIETICASHLLIVTGRTPNSEGLALDKAGIEVDSRGYIKVNSRLETGVPGIWALGDVKGGPAFTHISYNDYQIVFANVFEGKSLSIESRYLPYSLFTDPQLGRVGLTEKEARATGRKLKIGTFAMSNVARAIERDEKAGFMKLIVDAATDRILGAAILGIEGGELVQMLGALILADAPYTVLKGSVYIHPTLAEGLFGLMESVRPVT